MKVLYAALRHDPRNPDLASGVDYNFYSAFQRHGLDVKVVGPFHGAPPLIEREVRKLYKKATGKHYLKWDVYTILRSSYAVNQADKEWQPDVIFSLFPSLLAFYRGRTPCVFNPDLTFKGWQEGGAGFGDLALEALSWIEGRAVQNSTRIITFSQWCKDEMVYRHHADDKKILVYPMPSALPLAVTAREVAVGPKRLETPLNLLLVGREYKRKGIDIGIEIVRGLNARGIPAQLTVCGLAGQDDAWVRFVGPYKKSDPAQLAQYVALYRQAHFLLHPALFDPSPIVPAEAACFGVPTITNNTGGMATSVEHGVSGIILPKASPAEEYIKVIEEFLRTPDCYDALCQTARRRYEQEQNWEVLGRQVHQLLQEIAGRN